MASLSTADTIGIRSASSIAMTIQNLNIVGRNYYSSFFVLSSIATSNVVQSYINVNYVGPQMTYNTYGTARYIDCNIQIVAATTSPAQELAEVNIVEIGGKTKINHTATAYSVFSFYGDNRTLRILSNADVTINTSNSVLYSTVPINWEVQQDAKIDIITSKRNVIYCRSSICDYIN
jgi:hypothetical protein